MSHLCFASPGGVPCAQRGEPRPTRASRVHTNFCGLGLARSSFLRAAPGSLEHAPLECSRAPRTRELTRAREARVGLGSPLCARSPLASILGFYKLSMTDGGGRELAPWAGSSFAQTARPWGGWQGVTSGSLLQPGACHALRRGTPEPYPSLPGALERSHAREGTTRYALVPARKGARL